MAAMRDPTQGRPSVAREPIEERDDDDAVNEAVTRWRAASAAQIAAYDPADEARSALLFEMYVRSLRVMSRLRPSTPTGLSILARAVQEELERSGTADDGDIDWRLLLAVVGGVVDVLGPDSKLSR